MGRDIRDYVVAGGELAAMIVLESAVRLIPGALGCDQSAEFESFEDGDRGDYPQFTRPREYRGMGVPDVLLAGNHEEVDRWRETEANRLTQQRNQSPETPQSQTNRSSDQKHPAQD